MTPVRRVVVMCAAALALASCRVDAEVRVRLHSDGGGTVTAAVTLDAEAVARLEANGRALSESFRSDGFSDAGWAVSEWERGDGGSATLMLGHSFADEGELRVRLRELDDGNIVQGARVDRERGLFRSHDGIALDLDLRDIGTRLADDEELVASLQAAGLDPGALDAQLDTELQRSLRVRAVVEAPGGKEAATEVAPGDTETLSAGRSEFDTDKLVVLLIAALLVFLSLLLYLAASVSARRDRRRAEWVDVPEPDNRTPLM